MVYRERRIDSRTGPMFYAVLIAFMIGSVIPLTAWAVDLPSLTPDKPRTVVAAGVGYENAETSTITVKTYDAETGEILSEETYDLNVREDVASANSQPSERIFAGGGGPGADGLSTFTLRVYDATTGRFLWEGLLNLNGGDQEFNPTHRVMAQLIAPQATVIRVHGRSTIEDQPQFFLRAVNPVTGELVWSDHFSTGTNRFARTEYVNRAVVGQTEVLTAPSQQIEFHIRMTGNRGRLILWEDSIEPAVDGSDVRAGHDDAAEILPAWHGAELEEMKEEVI